MYIEMLYVFQRVYETQTGFSLEYRNINTRYVFYINILFTLHTAFGVHPFLYVGCGRTLKDARCKTKLQDTLTSQLMYRQKYYHSTSDMGAQ